MKNLFAATLLLALLAGCGTADTTALPDEDAALTTLLDELDECAASGSHRQCYRLYASIAAEYEKKNLTSLQKHYQQKMVLEAEAVGREDAPCGRRLKAEALQQLATTYMVEGQLDSAALNARNACHEAPADTLDFRAQTLLLLAQIHLMAEHDDSTLFYVRAAETVYPPVVKTDLYRITHAYALDLQGCQRELVELLAAYIPACGIHGRAELTRLLMGCHEEAEQWREAYGDAATLMELTDSIARTEASENMVRIHALQHERQMERQRAMRAAERAHLYGIIIVVLMLLLTASTAGLAYRRKARVARERELEAMRLSEEALANENQTREENIRLQRLYYEHLYAIILPILNANRGRSGHINLEEDAWKLIEQNTDMVLPGFSSRLRTGHPALTTEDIRFCCLIMMRVPNAVLADVYGIAPASVAVRKQRMKKKLDSDVQNQTIENYLNQYIRA